MSIRKISFVTDEFYHVYNRGNSRQSIFLTEADYSRFSALLYLANGTNAFEFRSINSDTLYDFERGEQQVAIGAYCLMSNHFHILLTPLVEGGVVTFMQKLATGYSMYFNKKHHRTGSLFEGKFRSEHANSDNYLKYLFSYIHLNPVKLIQGDWQQVGIKNPAEVMQYLEKYPYSSYRDGNITRPESAILHREIFPEYFLNKKDYDEEIKNWVSFKETKDFST
jgi:putative transposase